MDQSIAECNTIWTEEQKNYAIRVLQDGLSNKKLIASDYHIIRKYDLVNIGGIYKVRNIKSGLYMVTKNETPLIIASKHSETGHGGEKVTSKQIKDQVHNIPMSIIKQYISNYETCSEKRRRKETGPGMVFRPITVNDFNDINVIININININI